MKLCARPVVVVAAVFGLGMSACDRSPTPSSPDVLAVWDTGEITAAELDDVIVSLPPARRIPPAGVAASEWLRDQVQQEFARRLMERQAAVLTDGEQPPDAHRRDRVAVVEAQAGAYRLHQNRRLSVTREEVDAYVEAHRGELATPERRTFRSILVAADPVAGSDGVEAAMATARLLRDQAVAGASFEELARAESDSANAGQGGLVGPVTRSQLRPKVADVVFALAPGEISEVLSSPAGALVFEVVAVVPGIGDDPVDLTSAAAEILAAERRARIRDELLAAAADRLGIEVPEWPERGVPAGVSAPEDVVFELDGTAITLGDVGRRVAAGENPGEAYRELVSAPVFARALREEWPNEATAVADRVSRQLATEAMAAKSFREWTEALPVERLEAYFEANKRRFDTDPQLEVTAFSWRLDPGDPLGQLVGPRQFADLLRSDVQAARDAWARIEADDGGMRRVVPLTPVRHLLQTSPAFAPALRGEPAAGDVVGPYRYGDRLWVVEVETVVPSRTLEFDEARKQVLERMLREEIGPLRQEWIDGLATDHRLQILDDRLEGFASATLGEHEPAGASST